MTSRKRLAAAVLGSLALHALVIAGNWLPVAQPEDGLRELEVRLAPLPKVAPAAPAPRARSPRPRRAAPPPSPAAATVAAVDPLALPEPRPETVPAETAAPQPAAPEIPAPQPSQRLALAAESSTAIARNLPRRGRISYTVVYGDTQTYVGKVVQSWRADSGSYELASEAETEGLIDLFRPQRYRYLSKGRVTARGLQPESFLMSRTRRGRTEVAEARFDWSAGSLAYGPAGAPEKNVPLPANAQDFLSFIYQFVLAPPAPGHHRVPITTGTRFEVFDIDVGEESPVETPIGTMKALPIRQVPRPGSESIEIWLAADYRYLPVRIRHFDREGRYSGEQMVSEIRVSDE
jgi:hypothetical protein